MLKNHEKECIIFVKIISNEGYATFDNPTIDNCIHIDLEPALSYMGLGVGS